MSVVPILSGQAFGPEEITVLVEAIEHVCESLGFASRRDRELVAKTVLNVARTGVLDPAILRKATRALFVKAA
jgi:hypothetical protein